MPLGISTCSLNQQTRSMVWLSPDKEDVCKTMEYLLKKLDQNKGVLCLPIAELRTIYMQIAKTFAKAVEQERRVMKDDRIMQRRAPDGHKRKGDIKSPRRKHTGRFEKN